MHPTSEPAHESSSQTSPGAAKRTYDERAAFEEAKRNLGIVGDREQEFNRGLAILGKAYSIGMTLILVYFLLDAYQILVTAGRSLNIGSFLSYALPKVLPDAILVVPFLWIVLGWVKDGYINPRRLTMLYLLLCSLSGVLSFAGVFGMAQVLFPAFTALDPASHPAAASSIVTQALVAVITAGSAVLMFLLTRPAVGAVPSFAVIRKQMRAIEESTSGAEDEEELTREDVLRQLEKEEGPVKDSTEQLLRELSADYALSNDPAEKNRLLDEIQQVQRAQKAGVKPNFDGASAGGHNKPNKEAHEGTEATAGYAVASERAGRVRPRALRSAKRCMTVIIILLLFRNIQTFILLKNLTSSLGALSLLFTLGFPLIFIFIQVFLFWKTWEGHRWAHILILVCSAYEVLSRMYWFAQDFLMDSRYLTWLMEYLQSYDSMDLAISLLLSTAVGVVITILYIRNIVLLTRPSAWAYTATGNTPHSQVVGQNSPVSDPNSNEGGNRLN